MSIHSKLNVAPGDYLKPWQIAENEQRECEGMWPIWRLKWLHPGHPFLENISPSIDGNIVCWRDFWSIKQDMEFSTREEAEAFAEKLRSYVDTGMMITVTNIDVFDEMQIYYYREWAR